MQIQAVPAPGIYVPSVLLSRANSHLSIVVVISERKYALCIAADPFSAMHFAANKKPRSKIQGSSEQNMRCRYTQTSPPIIRSFPSKTSKRSRLLNSLVEMC